MLLSWVYCTGFSAVVSTIGYAVLRKPPVVPVINAIQIVWSTHNPSEPSGGERLLSHASSSLNSLSSHGGSNSSTISPTSESSELLCFEQWVPNGEAIELHVQLLCFAVLTLCFAVYFFLALPETDGKTYILALLMLLICNSFIFMGFMYTYELQGKCSLTWMIFTMCVTSIFA